MFAHFSNFEGGLSAGNATFWTRTRIAHLVLGGGNEIVLKTSLQRNRFWGVLAGPIFVSILGKRYFDSAPKTRFGHPGVFWGQFWVPFWFSFCTLFRMPNLVIFGGSFVVSILHKRLFGFCSQNQFWQPGPFLGGFGGVPWYAKFGFSLRFPSDYRGLNVIIYVLGNHKSQPRSGLIPVCSRITLSLGFKHGLV